MHHPWRTWTPIQTRQSAQGPAAYLSSVTAQVYFRAISDSILTLAVLFALSDLGVHILRLQTRIEIEVEISDPSEKACQTFAIKAPRRML